MRRKGFALVELLVVVAIILLLVALLIPVFTMVEEHVKYVGCINNMRNIYGGVLSYSNDYNGRMPFYIRPSNSDGTLTVIASLWAFPAMKYLIDIPEINPYTGNPWSMPGDNGYFSRYMGQYENTAWDILFCQTGDNNYYSKAYEGDRTYVSNYVGYFGPVCHCPAVARNRDYQDNNPLNFNRPVRLGHDPGSTWLLGDIDWGLGGGAVWAPHIDHSKNILHLDGSVFLTPKEYWLNSYVWVDRFPER
jgi:prepilin-type N-terminal cleavage/methylation domain-containing protein